jgi:hypothetical protein
MPLKRLITMSVLTALCSGVLPLAAFAEDGSSEDSSVSTETGVTVQEQEDNLKDDVTQETDDDGQDDDEDGVNDDDKENADDDSISDAETDVKAEDTEGDDEVEDDIDDVASTITEGEGEVVVTDEGTTVISEEVPEDNLTEEMQEDLEEASTSGAAPDQFYVAVMWGYFGEDKPNLTETTWDGTIFINNEAEEGVFSRPVKTLMFERQQDSIDFDNTTVNQTSFVSNIYNRTDGILFKVRTDLASNDPGKLSFATDYSTDVAAVYLEDLYNNGSAEFSYGAYKVVMKVLTREDWISAHSEHNSSDRPVPSDTEGGAWYLKYMNYSLDNNFFSGYKNEKGQLTGKIGPGDTLTRFETLKVLFQLSDKLNMGVAAGNCDPSTVTQSSSTDWMGTEWARGYVQCIEDSGVSVTLLTTIGSDTSVGQEPAQRWEVMASAFQMLGLDTDGAVESSLTDVDSSGLSEAFQSMLDKAVELGVISGYPDGTFKPYKTVNRAEMFKIVTLFYEVLSV